MQDGNVKQANKHYTSISVLFEEELLNKRSKYTILHDAFKSGKNVG